MDVAAVAQLDRVLGYEPRGRGFNSCQPHHPIQGLVEKLGPFHFLEPFIKIPYSWVMSVSDPISSNSVESKPPAVVWTQIDAANAKVALNGVVNVYSLGGIWTQIQASQNAWLQQNTNQTLTFDASRVSFFDGAGVAFLIAIEEAQQKAGGKFELVGLDPRYQPLLKEFDPINNLFPVPAVKPKRSFVVSTGMAAQNLINDTKGLVSFTGQLSADLYWSLRNPGQVRWGDFVNTAVEAGIAALPIVGLVSFLIGVILSFQA